MSHRHAGRGALALALASLAAGCSGGGGDSEPRAAASLSISGEAALGGVVLGGSAEGTLTVANAGTVAASGLSFATAAPFAPAGGAWPGTGGTCTSSTLAAGASCTVVVAFSPSARGAAAAALTASYHDGVAAAAAEAALSGVGLAPAALAFADAPLLTFADAPVGASATRSLSITNGGDVAAAALTPAALPAPYAYAGGYPGAGGTCASTLAPSASCTVVVTFAPAAPGAAPGEVSLSYASGAGTASASLALAGRGALPASLDVSGAGGYGDVVVGASAARTFTVANSGAVVATAIAAALSGPFTWTGGTYPGAGGTCGATLAGGASCALSVTFAPAAAGAASGGVTVSYHDGVAARSAPGLALAGGGLSPAQLELSGAPGVDFGAVVVGTGGVAVVTLTNSGDAPAASLAVTASGPFAFAGGAYPGAGGSCGGSIPPGASCTVALAFAPPGPGAASGSLAVAYHDGAGARAAARNLAGTGLAPAALALSGASHLGAALVGGSSEGELTLTNAAGGAGATSVLVSFGGPFSRAGGDCGASLAAGASCTLRVAFAAGARGDATGSVTVSYDDGAGAQATARPLSGVGLLPAALSTAPAPVLDLGLAAVGASTTAVLAVTNDGDVDATALDGAASGPFAFAGAAFPGTFGDCGPVLAPAATCTVEVEFLPTSPGAASGQLTLSFDDGLAAAAVAHALAGTGLAPASLDVAGAAGFGEVLVGRSSAGVFTIANSGEVPAALASLSLSGPFEWSAGTSAASGDCDERSPLASGESCTVEVAFIPAAPGDAAGSLSVSYSDAAGAKDAARALSGRGLAPALLALSDGAAYDFGALAVGARATHVVHVTNSGAWTAALGAVTVGAPFGFEGGVYPGAGGSCGATLGAGFSCRVVLAFQPPAAGAAGGLLSIPYDDGVSTRSRTLALSGSGTDLAALAIADFPPHYYSGYGLPPDGPVHDYGAVGVGRPASWTFHVTNTGAAAATALADGGLSGPFGWKGGTFPGAGGSCTATLAAGETCQVVVDFAPAGEGATSGALSLTYDDGMTGQGATRALAGAGTHLASLAVYDFEPGIRFGDAWDFGPTGVGVASEHEFLVANGGAGPASDVAGLAPPAGFAWKGGAFPGAGGTCAAILPAGASCRAVAVFQPAAAGQASGALEITYDDGSGATRTEARAVRGTGVTTALLAVEEEDGVVVSLGVVAVGGARDRALRVRNLGAADAPGLSARALGAPFSFPGAGFPGTGGTCGTSLAPGAECTAVVRFAPEGPGAFGAQVAVDYQDGGGAAVATRDLSGQGTDQALLAVADWPGGFDRAEPMDTLGFGTTASPVTRTLYVRNVGAQDATAVLLSTSAPFAITGTSCGATVAEGDTCTADVTFTPSGDGPAAAAFRIDYEAGGGPALTQQALSGTSTTRAAVFATTCGTCTDPWYPDSHDFGVSGVRLEQTLYLRNTGAQAAALEPEPLGGAPVFDWAAGGAFPGVDASSPSWPGDAPACGATLAAGSTCRLRLAFSPPAADGVHGGLLSVPYSDGTGAAGAVSLPLSGASTTEPLLEILDGQGGSWGGDEPPPIDFGTGGQDVSRLLVLANRGGGAATLGAATLPAGFAWTSGEYPGWADSGAAAPCGATLPAGEVCLVSITFEAGTLAAGTHSGTLAVAWGPGDRLTSRQLTGTAVDRALLAVAEWPGQYAWLGQQPYDFGTSAVPLERTFYVTNSGRQEATLDPAAFTSGVFGWTSWAGGGYPGGDPGEPPPPWNPQEGPFCGAALAPGATCRLSVTFTPPVSSLTYSDAVALHYGDAAGAIGAASRAITGTATDRAVIVIGDWPGQTGWPGQEPFDFGAQGRPGHHFFELRNDGAAAADLTLLPLGGAFTVLDASTAGLPAPQPWEAPDCPPALASGGAAILPPGEACRLAVEFGAPLPAGPWSDTLVVLWSDGLGPDGEARRELVGASVDGPLLRVADWEGAGWSSQSPAFDFGVAWEPVHHWFHVSNEGRAPASISSTAVGAGFEIVAPAPGEEPPGSPAPAACQDVPSLAPGERCALRVTFRPDGQPVEGPVQATLEIGYGTSSVLRDLSATVAFAPEPE